MTAVLPSAKAASISATDIASIDCFPARLPLRKPLVMATYRIDDGPVLFVRIRTRGGAEGWGEAAASPIMSGETLVGMQAAVETLIAPRLIGACALDRARLSRELRTSMFANGGTLAAVDMALLDLAGRILDVPAVALLGGAVRRTVKPLWLIGGSGHAEKDVDEARALHAQGFRSFKLKAGLKPVEDEIRTVRLLREALGNDCLIAADANMGWDPMTAIRFANGAAPFGLAFLEQPTPAGDVARMAAVAAGSPVPIGIDESLHGLADIHAHVAARATGGVSLKTIKLGGITPLVAAAGVCDALGLSVNLAMMMEFEPRHRSDGACGLRDPAYRLGVEPRQSLARRGSRRQSDRLHRRACALPRGARPRRRGGRAPDRGARPTLERHEYLERDAGGKPLHTFPQLERIIAELMIRLRLYFLAIRWKPVSTSGILSACGSLKSTWALLEQVGIDELLPVHRLRQFTGAFQLLRNSDEVLDRA